MLVFFWQKNNIYAKNEKAFTFYIKEKTILLNNIFFILKKLS
jgi:hypothetical protein